MKTIRIFSTFALSAVALLSTTIFASANWETGMNLVNGMALPGGDYGPGPIWILLSFFLWLLKIFVILSIISFVITGLLFLISGLNPGLRERAKEGLTYSIIAIAVAFSGILVLATVLAVLSGGAFLDAFL